jgi:hypothetical protein
VYSIYDKFLDIVMALVHFKKELRDEPKSNATDIIQRALAIDITLENLRAVWNASTRSKLFEY